MTANTGIQDFGLWLSRHTFSIVTLKIEIEFNFMLQLLKFLFTLVSTMMRKLSSTICITMRIVHCTPVTSLMEIYPWIWGSRTPGLPSRYVHDHRSASNVFCILTRDKFSDRFYGSVIAWKLHLFPILCGAVSRLTFATEPFQFVPLKHFVVNTQVATQP